MSELPEGLSAETYAAAVQAVADWEAATGEPIGDLVKELFALFQPDLQAAQGKDDITSLIDSILRERYGLLPVVP